MVWPLYQDTGHRRFTHLTAKQRLALFETEKEQRIIAPSTEDGHLKSEGGTWAVGGEGGGSEHSDIVNNGQSFSISSGKKVNHHCPKILFYGFYGSL